jgi:2-keto-3-deoxy-6-phosphogluconate aldolase
MNENDDRRLDDREGALVLNTALRDKYVRIHRQGFMPIFVRDELDAVSLAGACVDAGIGAIEITCRRPCVLDEVAAVKRAYPEMIVLAGSTVDDPEIVAYIKSKKSGMPSLDELADAGADGFVAQLPFKRETFDKFAASHILTPGVTTIKEAYDMLQMGAHFTKFCYLGKDDLKKVNGDPVHGIFPLFIVGGVTLDKVEGFVQAGAATVAAGWDVILGGEYAALRKRPDYSVASERVAQFANAVRAARSQLFPGMFPAEPASADDYLKSLTHYHPFWRG